MSKEKEISITNLQKQVLIRHIGGMHSRLEVIIDETSYLLAHFKAMKMILDNTVEISIKK